MRDEQKQQGGAGVPTTEEFYRILDLVRSVGRAYAGMYLERRESRKISKRQADEHFSEALVLAAQSREELTLLLKVLTWAAEEEARGKEAKQELGDEVKGIIERSFRKDGEA